MTTVADLVYQLGGLPTLPAGLPVGAVGSNYFFVDGTNGADGNPGSSPSRAFATIQRAFTVNGGRPNALVFVLPQKITDATGDPASYAETVIIDAPSSMLLGVSRGRTQGGLPQLKPGSGAVAAITVRAPGCRIAGMGINGNGMTGPGILLDDDNSTKSAFGTTIEGNHFKNIAPSATLASAGGAITWTAAGNAWQVLIKGNRFYKNTADVVLLGTTNSVPQDVTIEDNVFSGPAASVSCSLLLSGGSGMNGLIVQRNTFSAMPTAGGTNRVIDLTGCVGVLAWNAFGTTGVTYGAAGSGGLVPTTMMIAGNYQDGALIART